MRKPSQKQRKALLARKVYLFEHPYCEVCGEKAVHVHHIVYKSQGQFEDDANYIATCLDCHQRCHNLIQAPLAREDLWKIKGLNLNKMREKYRLIRKGGKKCVR